jgi:hypothetical protein
MQDYELRDIYKEVTQMIRETSNNDLLKTSCFTKTLLKVVTIVAITIVLICGIFAGCFIYITHQQYNYEGYPTNETTIGGDYHGNETTKADSNTATAKNP